MTSRGNGATKRVCRYTRLSIQRGGSRSPYKNISEFSSYFFFRAQVPRTVWQQLTCFSTNVRAPSRTGESAGQTTPQFLQLKRNIPRAPPRPNLRIRILVIIFFYCFALTLKLGIGLDEHWPRLLLDQNDFPTLEPMFVDAGITIVHRSATFNVSRTLIDLNMLLKKSIS